MRFLSLIFSFYLLFLAVEPGIKAIFSGQPISECCGGSCTPIKDEKKEQSNDQGNQDKNNTSHNADCNPFEACKACLGYTISISSCQFAINIDYVDLPLPVSDDIPSNLALDFWQPPKIA